MRPSRSSRPEPVSPAIPTISPGATVSETPGDRAARQILYLQDGRLRAMGRVRRALCARFRLLGCELLADEQVDDRVVVELDDRAAADEVAVAEDGEAVPDPEDLAEVVGYIQDADARSRPCA